MARKNMHIRSMPLAALEHLERELLARGITGDDLETALDSRLSDLEGILPGSVLEQAIEF